MKLTWLGHACFALEEDGYRIVTDPFTGVPGLPDTHTWANAVYCSHGHHDHHYLEGVTIRTGGKNPFSVEEIASCHDEKGGALRGENTIRCFEAGGIRIVHLGDLGHFLTQEQAAPLYGCDVLLIPVGGTYTIDGEQAAQVSAQLSPRIAVPMHYRGEHFGFADISTAEPFLEAMRGWTVERLKTDTMEIPSGVEKKIILLESGQ